MGRNREAGFPHKGWKWVGARDSRDNDGLSYEEYPCCEFCDKTQIRYVHILEHPNFPDSVEVGCECAEQLTEDYSNPQSHEKDLRNRASRRTKFPDRKGWKVSEKGNPYINYEEHHIIVIQSPKGDCILRIDGKLGKIKYKSVKEAQLKAFDVIQQKRRNA
jgi:hypothetical protein